MRINRYSYVVSLPYRGKRNGYWKQWLLLNPAWRQADRLGTWRGCCDRSIYLWKPTTEMASASCICIHSRPVVVVDTDSVNRTLPATLGIQSWMCNPWIITLFTLSRRIQGPLLISTLAPLPSIVFWLATNRGILSFMFISLANTIQSGLVRVTPYLKLPGNGFVGLSSGVVTLYISPPFPPEAALPKPTAQSASFSRFCAQFASLLQQLSMGLELLLAEEHKEACNSRETKANNIHDVPAIAIETDMLKPVIPPIDLPTLNNSTQHLKIEREPNTASAWTWK